MIAPMQERVAQAAPQMDPQAALDMADEDIDHVNELLRDAPAFHNAAREDEHRDRDERDGVHLREAVRQQLSRLVAFHIGSAEEDEPGAGGHEAYGNGDADDER